MIQQVMEIYWLGPPEKMRLCAYTGCTRLADCIGCAGPLGGGIGRLVAMSYPLCTEHAGSLASIPEEKGVPYRIIATSRLLPMRSEDVAKG